MEIVKYPAHYRRTDDVIQIVEEHLLGVSNLCADYAKEHGFEWTGRLLGLLHDIGKYTSEFQEYITEGIRREKEELPPLSKTIDHGKYGAIFLLDHYPKNSLDDQVMREMLAMVICYHHGGLEDYITDDLDCKLVIRCEFKEREEQSYMEAVNIFYERVMMQAEMDKIMQKSSEEFHNYRHLNENLERFDLHLLIRILYSCLIDADRYDTYCFMQKYDWEVSSENEKIPISKLWEIFDHRLAFAEKRLREKVTKGALETMIHNLRQDIWKQCDNYGSKPEGIYTLTVPTGGGKTLSSLRYAINHARNYNKKRIIYILPFTSIIEQNAAVVRDVLEAGDYLLEHHSNVVHEVESTDAKNTGTSDEKWEYYRLLTEQWTTPIIFTTMVQFLNTIFAGGTQNIRRLHNLTDAVLIFDEIQALPINCISLFNKTINYLHRKCRNTIILCSATQPNLDQVEHSICVDGEIIRNLSEKFQKFKRMEVKHALVKGGMSISELGKFVKSRKQENNSILVIMNTKSMAEKIYREVKECIKESNIHFYFLSTNLCSAHRRKIIKDMKEKLADGEHVICISTQLIEAGVDISFSCVVRHIAGLDSVAQAAGRGNRNGEGEVKEAYIVQVEGESLGSLDTIRYGEEATKAVLDAYDYKPERFDHDLLSPKALRCYYDNFYSLSKISGQMNYPIKDAKGTILEKLSDINKRNEYYNRFKEKCPTILQYQFRTAAKHFQVIDDAETSVVVPFGGGKELVQKLLDNSLYPDRKLIREAQQYSVNISKFTYEKLKEQRAIDIAARCGALVLDQRFYDSELGVVTEGKKMEVAMF
jgi:CRISPR-associated endonuclease/helicase Cas3